MRRRDDGVVFRVLVVPIVIVVAHEVFHSSVKEDDDDADERIALVVSLPYPFLLEEMFLLLESKYHRHLQSLRRRNLCLLHSSPSLATTTLSLNALKY